LTSTPGAFNDAKLIHQSGQPATIAASKTKEPEVSHPVVERIPITKSDIDVLPSNGVKANTPLSSALRNIEKNYLRRNTPQTMLVWSLNILQNHSAFLRKI